jgi:hypothetical protein
MPLDNGNEKTYTKNTVLMTVGNFPLVQTKYASEFPEG